MNKIIKLLPHKIRYSKMLEELEETYNREFKLRKRYGTKEFYLDLIIYGDKKEDDRVFLVLLNKVAMKYLRNSELELLSFEFRSV